MLSNIWELPVVKKFQFFHELNLKEEDVWGVLAEVNIRNDVQNIVHEKHLVVRCLFALLCAPLAHSVRWHPPPIPLVARRFYRLPQSDLLLLSCTDLPSCLILMSDARRINVLPVRNIYSVKKHTICFTPQTYWHRS
jgi:hypothetical protein